MNILDLWCACYTVDDPLPYSESTQSAVQETYCTAYLHQCSWTWWELLERQSYWSDCETPTMNLNKCKFMHPLTSHAGPYHTVQKSPQTGFISGGQGVLSNWLLLLLIWVIVFAPPSPLNFGTRCLPPLERNPEINTACYMHVSCIIVGGHRLNQSLEIQKSSIKSLRSTACAI